MASPVDGRTPVIVGVGAASQKFDAPRLGREAVGLMVDAARSAGRDSGADGLLPAVERIIVPSGSWAYSDPARIVADEVGARRARTTLVKLGVPQQALLNQAFCSILAGDLDVALVVAGEAKWRATLAQRAGVDDDVTAQTDVQPDDFQFSPADIIFPAERAAGAVSAVHQFAMIDNALRHAEGKTMAQQRHEIDGLWDRFNLVSGTNEHAAFPERRDAAFLGTPTERNRPLAFPYFKWHASQWNVDQACAILVTSLDAARAHGVPAERMLFPVLALESTWISAMSSRRDIHRWPAMGILRDVAETYLGRALTTIDLIELYSCFPAAVRVQQRELGLPLDGTPTVTGGMPFGGGPLNHFVLQATAALLGRLRESDASTAMMGSVSGMLAKPELAVYSKHSPAQPYFHMDLATEAERSTPTLHVLDTYGGPATIVTYTVTYEGLRPARIVVVADTADGRRCVTSSDDQGLARRATLEEVIGEQIIVAGPTAFAVAK